MRPWFRFSELFGAAIHSGSVHRSQNLRIGRSTAAVEGCGRSILEYRGALEQVGKPGYVLGWLIEDLVEGIPRFFR